MRDGFAPHFTGSASEHRVAALYLDNGVPIYWPAVQQGYVDFVAETEPGAFKRVQVKTATASGTGPHTYIQCRTGPKSRGRRGYPEGAFDLLAVVYGTRVWIIPAADIDTSNLCLGALHPGYRPRRSWDRYLVTS